MSTETGKALKVNLNDEIRSAISALNIYAADKLYTGTPAQDGMTAKWEDQFCVLGMAETSFIAAGDTPIYMAVKQDLEVYAKGNGLSEIIPAFTKAFWEAGMTVWDMYEVEFEKDTGYHHYHMTVAKVDEV